MTFITRVNMIAGRRMVVFLTAVVLLGTGAGLPEVCLGSNLNEPKRAAVVDAVSAKLRELYVYPEIGERMAMLISGRLENGEYDAIQTLESYVGQLNIDMLSVFPDGHLEVNVLRDRGPGRSSSQEWWAEYSENSRFNNFGFHRLDRLPGNVGYLELTGFDYPELAGDTLTVTMRYLQNTDALIIDLRQNSGGRGELVQILLSYFFEDHRVHYLTELDRVRKTERQWWTLPYVPGKRRPDTPLYVLTSVNTGSAAEEFAFALKNQGRATIVGGKTAGAAHKTHRHVIADLNIEIYMPDGRSYDPVSNKDWEGVGVTPDIPVEPARALDVAHVEALEKLLEDEEDANRRFRFEWALRALSSRQAPTQLDKKAMQRYVGVYGTRTISLKGNSLYYQRENRPRFKLVPLGDDWFRLQDLDYLRIRFEAGEDGAITTLVSVYDDGSENPSERSTN